MEIAMTLSSIEAQKVDSHNKPENFVTRLDKPLELGKNKNYLIGLDSGIMHYLWFNISPENNNNKIEYKATIDEPFKELTFRPGMFDYSDKEDYIDGWLINEGVITKKSLKKKN